MNVKFIALGDITVDEFITLKEADVNCKNENCNLSMRWGDKLPFEKFEIVNAVGNSPNASVSASRLGLDSYLISFVGKDEAGEECVKKLQKDNVNTDYIDVQDDKSTNKHYVLSFNAERTILVKHESFRYSLPSIFSGDDDIWLYFSSIGEKDGGLYKEVAKMLEGNKNVKLVFQPGTYQIRLGYENLDCIYKETYVFVCNKEEAKSILKSEESDIKKLLEGIYSLGPKIVSVTDGPNGAYVYDGDNYYFVPQYPDIAPPKERTGAGDSYTSAFVSFLAKGKTVEEALLRAPINSMSVVQHVGAQAGLLSEAKIEEFLSNAPDDYKVSKI